MFKGFLLTLVFLYGTLIQSVVQATPINTPHTRGAEERNTLFTSFGARSPKYLDPALSYSADETPFTYQIYEPLYTYHYLKRPYTLIPLTAVDFPKVEYRDKNGNLLPENAPLESIAQTWYTIQIQPNIRFQPHPAFAKNAQGEYRYFPMTPEQIRQYRRIPDFPYPHSRYLTAHDYVYGIKRLASPRLVSPIQSQMSQNIVGLTEFANVLKQADQGGTREWLDLRDFTLEGVRALDDQTLQIRIYGKYPQFIYWLSMTFFAPIPWEADRFYAQPGMAEQNLGFNYWPVGTGPYYLTEYRQNRLHVLEANPLFRGIPYPCEGEEGDQEKGYLADCGKTMPFIDRIEFIAEKEGVSLQSKFLQGYYDMPQVQRPEYGLAYLQQAQDYAHKANLYAERGLQMPVSVQASNWYIGFNWQDPIVGLGNTPEQQLRNRKLRQAISIATDWEAYVRLFENDQAEIAHGPVPPGILGYQDPLTNFNRVVYEKDEAGAIQRKSLAEAQRLLAEAGYPGGRNAQTGEPLVLYFDAMVGTSVLARSRYDWLAQQWQQLGIQLEVRSTDFNSFQDKMRKGSAQIFEWGWAADFPDAENFLSLLYGPHGKVEFQGENASNYKNADFDALYTQMLVLADGPERAAIIEKMVEITRQDAAWIFGHFPHAGGLYHQWVGNAKPTQMVRNPLMYMRIDPELRTKKIAEWNRPIFWPIGLFILVLALLTLPLYRFWRRRERTTAYNRQGE